MDHYGYSEEVIYGCNYYPPGLIIDFTKSPPEPMKPYEIVINCIFIVLFSVPYFLLLNIFT